MDKAIKIIEYIGNGDSFEPKDYIEHTLRGSVFQISTPEQQISINSQPARNLPAFGFIIDKSNLVEGLYEQHVKNTKAEKKYLTKIDWFKQCSE